MMNMSDHAVRLAISGTAVFPCVPDPGPREKRPFVEGGFKSASKDIQQVKRWWNNWPAALIGMVPGQSGYLVVDLDPKGDETAGDVQRRLEQAIGEKLPETPVTVTQSSGQHLWFRKPEGVSFGNNAPVGLDGKKVAGVDIRCDNGYVILPPSKMKSGAIYREMGSRADAPEMPQALIDALTRNAVVTDAPPPRPPQGRPKADSTDPGDVAVRAYAETSVENAAREVATCGKGSRGETLNTQAFVLGKFVGAGVLTAREVWDALIVAADTCGLTATDGKSEVSAKIQRGISAGKQHCGKLQFTLDEVRRNGERRAATQARQGRQSSARAPKPGKNCKPASATLKPAETRRRKDPPAPDFDVMNAELAWLPLNDKGNGQRFLKRFGDDAIYVRDVGWFVWTGQQWKAAGADAKIRIMAHKVGDLIKKEALELAHGERPDWWDMENDWPPKKKISDLMDWHVDSGNRGRISAMQSEAAPYVTKGPDDVDNAPMRINLPNGTLDLPGGEGRLHPHFRGDLLTKMAAADYDPDAKCPEFDAFLAKVQPDPEVRAFLARWYGYNLTSDISEQKLIFHYGEGSNGKSVLVDIIARIMGDYAVSLPFQSLIRDDKKRGAEATPDLARLQGARMVRASEPEQGARFAEATIKQITGGEEITVRHLHQGFFDLVPEFAITLSGNHRPKIKGDDHGIWRRMLLVPWTVIIPDDEQDAGLPGKLWGERSGIFNWMLDGLALYLEFGLGVPDGVTAATDDYRSESDPLGRFLEACVEEVPEHMNAQVNAREMYQAYCNWCAANGERAWTETTFGKTLPERGYKKKRGVVRSYINVQLKDVPEAQPKGAE